MFNCSQKKGLLAYRSSNVKFLIDKPKKSFSYFCLNLSFGSYKNIFTLEDQKSICSKISFENPKLKTFFKIILIYLITIKLNVY